MQIKRADLETLVSVARLTFLSLSEKINLLKNIDSASSLALLSIEEIGALCRRKIKIRSWDGMRNLRAASREAKIIEAKKIGFALYADGTYPPLLREISDPPFMLFYTGDISILAGRTVSVVGTRRVTPDGKKAARDFAYEAANDGVAVVSGLAFGADAAAHLGAIDAYFDALENSSEASRFELGRTAAVLPCGCDTVTPKSHIRLSHNILRSGGCLVSEYLPGAEGEPWRFVQRNRIIAALSPAVVVVQAAAGSGALITAQYALEYDREVMFHASSFSESAKRVSDAAFVRLEKDFAAGKVSRAKLESRPQKFLADGAPVIKDYKDFCACLAETPGGRNCTISDEGQPELPVV
ncbi:MAG: DNA-processing protein DprA [Treponema sp.]